MKKITVISSFLLACVASSCRNEDVYVAEDARQAKYNQEWVNKYGPIDPNQTFNMAETKDMSITVSEDSNVKIYFESDGKRFIAADYQLKSGTTSVKFDVPADVECIQVIKDSPKRTAQSLFMKVQSHMNVSFGTDGVESRADLSNESVPTGAKLDIVLSYPKISLPNCYALSAEATGGDKMVTTSLPHDIFWEIYGGEDKDGNSVKHYMAEEQTDDYVNLESINGIGDIVFETTGGPVSMIYLGGKTSQSAAIGYFYLPLSEYDNLNQLSAEDRNSKLRTYKRYYFMPSTTAALDKVKNNKTGGMKDYTTKGSDGIDYRNGVKYNLIYFDDNYPDGTYNFPKDYKIVFFHTINTTIDADGRVDRNKNGGGLLSKFSQLNTNDSEATGEQWYDVVMDYSISSVSDWNEGRKFYFYNESYDPSKKPSSSNCWTANLRYKGYTFFGFEDKFDAVSDEAKDFNDAIFTIDGAIDGTDIP